MELDAAKLTSSSMNKLNCTRHYK